MSENGSFHREVSDWDMFRIFELIFHISPYLVGPQNVLAKKVPQTLVESIKRKE